MADLLNLPKDPDKQKCLACDSPHLDTGWECTDCGYDNQPWYDRAAERAKGVES